MLRLSGKALFCLTFHTFYFRAPLSAFLIANLRVTVCLSEVVVMKSALLILAAILISGGLYFLMTPGNHMHILLVGNSTGTMATRDQEMLSLIESRFKAYESELGITFRFSVLDGNQPPDQLVAEFKRISTEAPADLVIGCGDSFCLRQVLPVVEKNNLTFLYPGASEGLFDSASLVHLGPVPNQFLFPSLSWIKQHLGKSVMYLGGEDIRSRMLGRMLRQHLLPVSGIDMVSEEYLGAYEQVPSILEKIRDYQPDVLLFDACDWLNYPGFSSELSRVDIRIFSLCTDSDQRVASNYYFVSHYFDHPHNQANVEFKQFVAEQVTEPDALNAMAIGAADLVISLLRDREMTAAEISYALRGRNLLSAAGSMAVDVNEEGTWHTLFIVQNNQGETRLLWMSDTKLRPEMFPGSEGPSDWLHNVTIYWRNNRGRYRTGSIGGKEWL